jgi:hypothetical protein
VGGNSIIIYTRKEVRIMEIVTAVIKSNMAILDVVCDVGEARSHREDLGKLDRMLLGVNTSSIDRHDGKIRLTTFVNVNGSTGVQLDLRKMLLGSSIGKHFTT